MDERTLQLLEYPKIRGMLAERTSSVMGRELAGGLAPSDRFEEVAASLEETADGVALLLSRGGPPPGGLHDIRQAMDRLRIGGNLGMPDLLRTAGFLSACRALRQYISGGAALDPENRVAASMNRLMTDRTLENHIFRAIRSDEEMADDASPALSAIRRKIREKQESVREKLNSALYSPKYQKIIQEPIITLRDGRYVIPIRQENRAEFPGIVHDVSASGATLFMEPMSVVEANNDIRQLKGQEQQEMERILAELSGEVAERLDGIRANLAEVAFQDFVLARAKLALDMKGFRPILDAGQAMAIQKGRHPLLDSRTVVPIDIAVGRDYHTLIITGPNTGGKTVSLKTAGLLALMAQSGLFLPAAEGTRMPVFHEILADIGDEQSIAQSLSTFSSHMRHIVGILEKAAKGTLVLLDELGAGTDPTEGAALGMAVLEELGRRGSLTMATTHYAELKVYAETTPGVENASCEFDVDTLQPTYKLLTGLPGRSNAFAISERLGLDIRIIERAKAFLTGEEIRFEEMLGAIDRDRKTSMEALRQAEAERDAAARMRREMETKKTEMEQKREQILLAAREQAGRVLTEARKEALAILNRLRELGDVPERRERNREGQALYQSLKEHLDEVESLVGYGVDRQGGISGDEAAGSEGLGSRVFRPGDSVTVISLNRKGEVITAPGKNGEAQVRVGMIKINIPVSDLRHTNEEKEETARTTVNLASMARTRTVSASLDLRGMTVDEAVTLIDRYLDDAGLAGLHEISIIHGKGTGALRKGIHDHLKSLSAIRSFRIGRLGEGDAGVTVVEL